MLNILLLISIKYRPARDFDNDLKSLLEGVTELDIRGTIFSEILAHGSLAFPIGVTEDGRPFLAGAYYGLGRILVISHEGTLRNKVQLLLEIRRSSGKFFKHHFNAIYKLLPICL